MKKIIINSENRRFNISSMVIGYLEENKAEKIEFEIPKEYQNYGKKACFSANGTTFAKLFDNITSNILTITRDISQFNELDLSIEFFKTENEDEIIARTSILHIVIENAVVCEDVKPDDEKVVILNELIEKVTNLESESTKNEELRQENEQNRIKNEEERVQYFDDIKEKVENGDFNGKDAMINGVNTLEIVEGENISLQQQANVLTISNTYQYDDSEIKGNIEEIKQNLINYSLVTETGSKVALNINPSTYVMTLELKDKNNNTISSGNVDLPLETMVVGATYNNETKEIEFTLQNGTKVSFSVADLVSGLVNEDDLTTKLNDYALKTSIPTKLSQLAEDSTHRLVTDTEKATWNNKVDKVGGKGLSTNDFTNELKTKLDGIEDNAQVNKIEKISIDGVEQEITEKEVNIKSYDINKYFYNALTYNELKGNDLTFEDSIEFPLGKLNMDGKSEQDLSKMIYKCNGTETGDYYFTYEDTNYQFTMPSVTSSSILVFDTLTLKLSINDEEITTSNSNTGTLIELSATPNPDYPQEINSIEGDLEYIGYGSKNFIGVEDLEEKTENGLKVSAKDQVITLNGKSTLESGYPTLCTLLFNIPKKTDKYTFKINILSGNKNGLLGIRGISSTNGQLWNIQITGAGNFAARELTDEEIARTVKINLYTSTLWAFENLKFTIQLTKGTSATDYVPYVEPRILTIPTNGQVFRKVKDVADKLIIDMKTGDYYKQQYVKERILNGSENYIIGTPKDITQVFQLNGLLDNNQDEVVSNIFSKYSDGDNEKIRILSKALYIAINKTRLSELSVSAFKQWISENNITIDYPTYNITLEKLGTLTKEQLDTLVTFKGYNNVMINTNMGQADIEIEYVLDMKKYIDNKIAEISAQMI